MPPNPTAAEGQVYRSPKGRAALYVRHEQRPGRTAREHLLIETEGGIVLERWLPVDAGFPGPFELVLDPDATGRANRLSLDLKLRTAERDALAAALRRAVSIVPVAVASDLRRIYADTLGRAFMSTQP